MDIVRLFYAGPAVWSDWFPVAMEGHRQSPVNILTTSAAPVPALNPLKYSYELGRLPTATKLVNSGATWRLDFSPEGSNLSGGPLQGNYKVIFRELLISAECGCRYCKCTPTGGPRRGAAVSTRWTGRSSTQNCISSTGTRSMVIRR